MGPGLSPLGGGGVKGLFEFGGPPGDASGDRTRRARGDRKRGSDPGGDFKRASGDSKPITDSSP